MSIFSRLFRSRDKPPDGHRVQNKLGSAFSFFFGGTSSGKTVTERTALQTTAVYACVRLLAESVAGLPVHIYQYKDNGEQERVTNHPLYFLLHDEPNPEMTSFVFR
jgi:phage portal protein BeeE